MNQGTAAGISFLSESNK